MASDANSVFITASSGFERNIESFHFARKGLAFDAENVGGLRLIPARGSQDGNDVTFLRLIERYQPVLGLGGRGRGGGGGPRRGGGPPGRRRGGAGGARRGGRGGGGGGVRLRARGRPRG